MPAPPVTTLQAGRALPGGKIDRRLVRATLVGARCSIRRRTKLDGCHSPAATTTRVEMIERVKMAEANKRLQAIEGMGERKMKEEREEGTNLVYI